MRHKTQTSSFSPAPPAQHPESSISDAAAPSASPAARPGGDFLCPISLSIMSSPVLVPCCGRSFSRDSLVTALSNRAVCPLCNSSLRDFDASTAPPNRSLQDAIELANTQELDTPGAFGATGESIAPDIVAGDVPSMHQLFTAPHESTNGWAVDIEQLVDDSGASHGAHLRVKCLNPALYRNEEQLLLLVLDISTSMHWKMGGAVPLDQAIFAQNALRDMASTASASTNVRLATVAYNQHYILDPSEDQMRRGGGTSFFAAFQGVRETLARPDLESCKRATVIFLTDGKGESDTTGLFAAFERHVADVWSGKQLIVHTVGFSSDHEFTFLDALRTKGTDVGMFQFADPNEDDDALFHKLTALAAPILRGGSAKAILSIPEMSFEIELRLVAGRSQLWLDATDAQSIARQFNGSSTDTVVAMVTAGGTAVHMGATLCCTNDYGLWLRWYSHLTDVLLQHLLDLDRERAEMPSDDFTVAALLVQQRAQALEVALSTPAPDSSELPDDVNPEAILARISRALSSAAQLLVGRVIDRRAMTDLRYQAQLAVKRRHPAEVPRVVGNAASSDPDAHDAGPPDQEEVPLEDGPDTIVELTLNLASRRHLPPRCETDTLIFRAICQARTDEVPLNAALVTSVRDALGQTPLHLAASIGRSRLVKRLLAAAQDSSCVFLNKLLGQKNNANLTPLDSALVHGNNRTAAALLVANAILSLPVDSLLLSLIQRGRFRTAELILKAGLVRVNHEIVRRSGSRQAAAWAMEHLDLLPEDEIRLAIRLGLPHRLKKHDPALVTPVKFSQCSHLWGPDCHAGHVRVIKWLLGHGRIDPTEMWTAPAELVPPAKRGGKETTSEPEDGWPLLLAAASGNVQLTQVLLSYSKDSVNQQTHSGRTPLSLACFKNHVSIVHALLEAGADPNICETAGNPPLVPVCWQGNVQIAKLLLQHGADPRLHDPERDSTLLICARTGHADILTAVLKVFCREELPAQLEWRAAIDGFDALEAAVEQDRVACLPILVAAGADVTRRTAMDNVLLPGATAIHLAAHFGSVACLRMLHTLGADLSARTNEPESRTPLHLAVMRGHVETTAFLLSLGEGWAQLTCKDGLGKLPRYYATMQGNERVYNRFFHNALGTPLLKCILAGSPTTAHVLAKYAEASPLLTLAKHVQTLDLGCSGLSPMSLDALLHGRNGHVARILAEHGGCAWSTPDASGLSPAFYGQLLWRGEEGFVSEGVREDQGLEDERMMDPGAVSALARLAIFEQSDTQARLLLDLSKLQPESQAGGRGEMRRNVGGHFFPLDPVRAAVATDMGAVMNEGFGCRADDDAAEEFTDAMADGDAVLLGLVERLLRQLLPDRHSEVLYAAKLSVIRAVGLGLVPAGARAAELLAMHLATADVRILQRLNQCLLTASMQDDGWMAAAVSLAKGMTKLSPYVGECYRRVAAGFTRWAIGTVLSWDAFTVCSADWATVTDDRVPGLVFVIKSDGGGRLLGPLAAVPQNAPVVFPPHARFRVVAFYRYSPTALGQANIRETSFAAKAAHFAKAEEGRASMIVEVEEVAQGTG